MTLSLVFPLLHLVPLPGEDLGADLPLSNHDAPLSPRAPAALLHCLLLLPMEALEQTLHPQMALTLLQSSSLQLKARSVVLLWQLLEVQRNQHVPDFQLCTPRSVGVCLWLCEHSPQEDMHMHECTSVCTHTHALGQYSRGQEHSMQIESFCGS